jgi:hypothetical protein
VIRFGNWFDLLTKRERSFPGNPSSNRRNVVGTLDKGYCHVTCWPSLLKLSRPTPTSSAFLTFQYDSIHTFSPDR